MAFEFKRLSNTRAIVAASYHTRAAARSRAPRTTRRPGHRIRSGAPAQPSRGSSDTHRRADSRYLPRADNRESRPEHDTPDVVLLKEAEDLGADCGVIPDVGDVGEPLLHLAHRSAIVVSDAHGHLAARDARRARLRHPRVTRKSVTHVLRHFCYLSLRLLRREMPVAGCIATLRTADC